MIPLEVIHQGYRYLYEPEATAREVSPSSVEFEFRRKVRTIRGGLQAARECSWMFTGGFWEAGFHYCSWKIAKHLVPVWALLFVASTSVLAIWDWRFRYVVALACATVLVVLASAAVRKVVREGFAFRFTSAIWYLVLANVAAVVALYQFAFAARTASWTVAPRAKSVAP